MIRKPGKGDAHQNKFSQNFVGMSTSGKHDILATGDPHTKVAAKAIELIRELLLELPDFWTAHRLHVLLPALLNRSCDTRQSIIPSHLIVLAVCSHIALDRRFRHLAC